MKITIMRFLWLECVKYEFIDKCCNGDYICEKIVHEWIDTFKNVQIPIHDMQCSRGRLSKRIFIHHNNTFPHVAGAIGPLTVGLTINANKSKIMRVKAKFMKI